jgi:hypothetical protein
MGQQTRWAGDRFPLARDDAVAGLQSSRVSRPPGHHTADEAPVRTRDHNAQYGAHGRLGAAGLVTVGSLCRNADRHRSLRPGCLALRPAMAGSRVARQRRPSIGPRHHQRTIAKSQHGTDAKQPPQPSSHLRLPLTVRCSGHASAAPWPAPPAGTLRPSCGPPAFLPHRTRASLPQSVVSARPTSGTRCGERSAATRPYGRPASEQQDVASSPPASGDGGSWNARWTNTAI